jgi:hypothetical protein
MTKWYILLRIVIWLDCVIVLSKFPSIMIKKIFIAETDYGKKIDIEMTCWRISLDSMKYWLIQRIRREKQVFFWWATEFVATKAHPRFGGHELQSFFDFNGTALPIVRTFGNFGRPKSWVKLQSNLSFYNPWNFITNYQRNKSRKVKLDPCVIKFTSMVFRLFCDLVFVWSW